MCLGLGYRYPCLIFISSQLCEFKVVSDLHKVVSPKGGLVAKICVQVFYLRINPSREIGEDIWERELSQYRVN